MDLVLRPLLQILILSLMAFIVGCQSLSYTTSLYEVMDREIGRRVEGVPNLRCSIGAHRGASVDNLENTLSALKKASCDSHYAFIEFDVQYTADNQIVVFHDRKLLRLFGSLDSIGDLSYAELYQKSKGAIALYDDVMDAIDRKKLNIEIKSQGDDMEDARLADAIIADVRRRGWAKELMISSISADVISYVRQRYPHIPTGQIFWVAPSTYLHFDILTEHLYERFNQSKADYLMLHVANIRNIKDLIALKPEGKSILFWDFDDRMYFVHCEAQDRLWGISAWSNFWQRLSYGLTH